MDMVVETFTEIVFLDKIREVREMIETGAFTKDETSGLLSVQTLAGFYCVKSALACAFSRTGSPVCSPMDFVLGHGEAGEPVIRSMPKVLISAGRKVSLSISHSRRHAVGLVVLSRESCDA